MYRSILTVVALSALALTAAVVASLLQPAAVASATTASATPAVLSDDVLPAAGSRCPALTDTTACPYLTGVAASSRCPYLAARAAASRCPALGGNARSPRPGTPYPGQLAQPGNDPILRASNDTPQAATADHS